MIVSKSTLKSIFIYFFLLKGKNKEIFVKNENKKL